MYRKWEEIKYQILEIEFRIRLVLENDIIMGSSTFHHKIPGRVYVGVNWLICDDGHFGLILTT